MKEHLYDVDAIRRSGVERAIADALSGEPDVVFAYLHGSFVGPHAFHDIDVGVHFDDAATGHTRRIVELADRLSKRVGYPVDVRALNEAPLPFVFHALQGRLLMSRDDERLVNVIERTGRRYLDIAPVLRRATRDAFAR